MNYSYLIATLLFFNLNGPSVTQTSDLVSISVDKVVIEANSMALGTIHVKIEKGYHIQSNEVDNEYIIPTEMIVKGNDFIRLAELFYPRSKAFNLEGSDIILNVYDGEIEIKFQLKTDPHIIKGELQLDANIRYQACDAKSCFAPRTIEFMIPVEVIN